jgi:SAM-dependent methyltransferase
VGSGSGAVLLELEEAGWRCHGVEISERAVAAARSAGLTRISHGDLLESQFPERYFDGVRFWHSLEHMRSPRDQLAEAHRILRPRGTLTLGVPNFSSLLARVCRDRWFDLDPPRHLWHFEIPTLLRLVREAGFVVNCVRNVSYSAAILGTIAYLTGRTETLTQNRPAWFALQPLAALLDTANLGDEIQLIGEAV